MKKLKKKVFLVIFLILSVVTTGIITVYNVQLYNQQLHITEHALENTFEMGFRNGFDGKGIQPPEQENGQFHAPTDENFEFSPDDFGNMRFLDSTVYTVFIDSEGNIDEVINHSRGDLDEAEIKAIAADFIAQDCERQIGNLYTAPYSFVKQNNSIVIVDNSDTNSQLRRTLLFSLLMWALAELLICLLAWLLTRWIAKPVAESFDKQKQFIADASHELKTPLAVIIASADALESNPTEQKWLDNIKSESDRMSKLIADLLELAKTEEVKDDAAFTEGNLSKLVEKATLTFESVMFEKGVALEDDIQDGIALSMDAYKITQLLSILLDNAIKHSKKGGTIAVSLKKDKDIVLQVTNEGEGIPAGEEEKIFERFYRADESRNRNENRYGLGLAIAKNICEAHQATISAKSESGQTTFKVVFKTR